MRERPAHIPEFVVCVDNEGYEVSLDLNKLYRTIPDPEWERRGCVRVIDESGEDYVYSWSYFADPASVRLGEENPMLRAS